MRVISRSARHFVNAKPDTATYEQCQRIHCLMKQCGLEPVWVENMPYAQTIALITRLEAIKALQHQSRAVLPS